MSSYLPKIIKSPNAIEFISENSDVLKNSSMLLAKETYNQAVTYISENKELFIDIDDPTDANKTYDNMVEFTTLVGYYNNEALFEDAFGTNRTVWEDLGIYYHTLVAALGGAKKTFDQTVYDADTFLDLHKKAISELGADTVNTFMLHANAIGLIGKDMWKAMGLNESTLFGGLKMPPEQVQTTITQKTIEFAQKHGYVKTAAAAAAVITAAAAAAYGAKKLYDRLKKK
jgi:hypothetical protein